MITLMEIGVVFLIILPVIFFRTMATIDYLYSETPNKKRKKVLKEYRQDYSLFERIALKPLKRDNTYRAFYIMDKIITLIMIIVLIMFLFSLIDRHQIIFAYSFAIYAIISSVFIVVILYDIGIS